MRRGPFPRPAPTGSSTPRPRGDAAERTRTNPLGRVGQPAELADLAAYLVSPAAAYVNGEMVTIDGGAHLRTSGAEDLLAWSPEQWAALRAQRGR